MKTRIDLFFTLIVSLISCSVAAQKADKTAFDQVNVNSLGSGARMFQSFDNRFKGVQGFPTLFEEYVRGTIVFSEGQVIRHDKMNYDAYNSDLLVIKDGKEMVVAARMVKHFILMMPDEEDSLIFTRLITDDNKLGFYEVLANHKNATLYKKHFKILQGPTYTGAYSTGQNHSELVDAKKFMMWCSGKQLAELKTKKQLFEYLPEYKSQLQEFVKAEKIDFKNEADLIKLFGKVNELHGSTGS
jgi:hypothetical protein